MAVMLTPPWYTLVNEIKYTYGMSPFIFVGDLIDEGQGAYTLPINVTNNYVAIALRQIIPTTFSYSGGQIVVTIVIYDAQGEVVPVNNTIYTPQTLAKLFCIALKNNPLFKGSVLRPAGVPTTIGNVTIIIAKKVVQFYNDDISDLCGNYNEVAAKTFAAVTIMQYAGNLTVGFSTFDAECELQKKIYCPISCRNR